MNVTNEQFVNDSEMVRHYEKEVNFSIKNLDLNIVKDLELKMTIH